jgi:nitrogen-specific signal transduction histidine kinase/CheY-like chemotaxis protein
LPGKTVSVGRIDIGRILEHVGEAAVVVDLSTRVVLAANPRYLERSGYTEAEVADLDLGRLHDVENLARILQTAGRCRELEAVVPGVACLTRDGGSFGADLSVIPLGDRAAALALLVYRAPADERSKPGGPDLSSCTLALAGIRTTDGLGVVLGEAARGLMGTETLLLVAQSAPSGAPDVVISAGLGADAQGAISSWLSNLIGSGLLSIETPGIVRDLSLEEALARSRPALIESGIGACVIFALEDQGRVAGAWALGYPDLARAEACDRAAGRAFAAHLSGSLAGALLLERTRREKRRHEVLNRIISWLRGPFDLTDILKSLTAELGRALEADRCFILATAGGQDDPDAQLRVQVEHHDARLSPLPTATTIKFSGTSLGGAVLYSKEPLAVDDLQMRPDLNEDHLDLLERIDLRGMILAKIVSHQAVIGLVVVATCGRPRSWTREDVELVHEVADHAALTLETDRLASSSRERAEQIERERREWERTFDAIPDMLAIHDGYGRLLRTNLALQVRLGGDPRAFIGKECADILSAVMGRAEGCPHAEAMAGRRSITREMQGETGCFALTAIPCFDAAGRCLYIIHVCKDVTEERQMREQLLQSEKMAAVGGLVSGVAHELNNPLTGVVGFSELLLKNQQDPALKKSLQRIHDEANRAARIVGNLLTFARKHRPESVMVNINAVLEKTLDLRAYELRVNKIKVVSELAPDLPRTLADPNQLLQVFMNIITNAEQAMRDAHGKGTLTIRSIPAGDVIRVEIQDDGPGIAAQHIKKIFDPFFTTKPVGKGTGLGLSICHGILKEHGGTIEAASTPGQGTTLSIALPIVKGATTRPETASVPDRRTSPGCVLVVDDEPFIRDLVLFLLGGRGHTVEAVNDGLAALEKIKSRAYDLIVSDLKMPELDGQELFARIRSEHPDMARRVLFISGDTVSSETRSFLAAAGQPYVLKPFLAKDLIDEVEGLLETTRRAAAAPGKISSN